MENITIAHINISSPKYKQVWELREEILRKPIGLSLKNEDLSWDNEDVMFVAEHEDKVIGCLMLHDTTGKAVKLRQMAVYSQWQGKGIGKMLVLAAEKFCFQKGYDKIVLHARKEALGFYKTLGYNIYGDEFTEVGIPHFAMKKRLNAP
jgi:predicted GNAT family N-acyltransferase